MIEIGYTQDEFDRQLLAHFASHAQSMQLLPRFKIFKGERMILHLNKIRFLPYVYVI